MFNVRRELIPRYLWDYDLQTLKQGLRGVFERENYDKDSFEVLFGQRPLFTSSGRTSLFIILKALEIPPASRIGVPLYCCPVVFETISRAELIPEFLDISLDDYNLSLDALETKKLQLTAVVVPHMFGNPADIDGIKAVSGNLPIIEDCAQSFLSTYKGQFTGFGATASFFSFRSGKYLSAGAGSAMFSKDPALWKSFANQCEGLKPWNRLSEIAGSLSTFAKSSLYHKPWYGLFGYPIGRRLDETLNLSAKSGLDFKRIRRSDLNIIQERVMTFQDKISKQRENALFLAGHITLKDVRLPMEREDSRSNYYQFAVRFRTRRERDRASEYLLTRGIDAARYLENVAALARAEYSYRGDCPNAELCADTVLVIPHYYTLSTSELTHIATCFNELGTVLSVNAA
jgi:perosamine synthetase